MSVTIPTSGERLTDSAPEILGRWDRRVRAEIPASRAQKRLVLQNNLGPLLAEVARALSPTGEVATRIHGLTLSQDHGGHRALLADYGIDEVFLEYRLLRKTILEVLDETQSLTPDEREVINNALERAMQDAVTQFARVQQEADQHRAEAAERVSGELRTAYERERRIAQALQRPLRLKIAENAVAGLSLATVYEPAWAEAEVGGDFFDIFALPAGRVALVVGDVCGKGLEAAARTTQVKDVLRAYLQPPPHEPGAALARLNDFMCDALSRDHAAEHSFIALALAVIDAATGETVFACAGAEPPLVLKPNGASHEVEAGGMLLGVQPGERYAVETVQLKPEDTLVMLTDGITEARAGVTLLGYPGMVALARASLEGGTLQEAGPAILAGARAFAGGALSDDACMILARRR